MGAEIIPPESSKFEKQLLGFLKNGPRDSQKGQKLILMGYLVVLDPNAPPKNYFVHLWDALCVASDSDSDFQISYQNQTTLC